MLLKQRELGPECGNKLGKALDLPLLVLNLSLGSLKLEPFDGSQGDSSYGTPKSRCGKGESQEVCQGARGQRRRNQLSPLNPG